jgi:DNA-binding NarL/FixJ family response regulator
MIGRMIKVLVADDQALLRAGLTALLGAEPDLSVIGEAADGAEAVELALRLHPDVVLMDVEMPGLDGIGATRRLRAAGSRARVLVVTTFGHDAYVYRALRAGANGFLLKATPPERLPAAVRAVAAGETVLDPAVTARLVEHFLTRPELDTAALRPLEQLTERERQVLRLLARGLSNVEMGRELCLSDATVKSHVTRMLGKLGVGTRVQAVVLAYETGLVRPGDHGRTEGTPNGVGPVTFERRSAPRAGLRSAPCVLPHDS